MRFAVYPYKTGSNSAKRLASALGCKVVKHQGSHYQKYSSPGWWTVNYGSTSCPSGSRVLNSSLNVSRAANKLSFFNLVKDYCRVPEYTTDIEIAKSWFPSTKYVVERHTLTGHSGQGIKIVETSVDLTSAKMYTKYVFKDSEYRLHFFAGSSEPFFIQRKAKRQEGFTGTHDLRVRNLTGGWVYVHGADNVGTVPKDVLDQASAAFGHSGLDFGSLDIVYRKAHNKAYVLEMNTASGLEGETVLAYRDRFLSLTN